MIYLEEKKLFGDGLFEITAPKMVDLYNRCLVDMGIEPTKLSTFSIDGWGWSPEIAEEKNDNVDYLSYMNKPMGIFITPSQFRKPLYHPFHSFDRDLVTQIFEEMKDAIQFVTMNHAIWFSVNTEKTKYVHPGDLLSLNYVSVDFHSVSLLSDDLDIIEVARSQKELEKRFYNESLSFDDQELLTSLIESKKLFGDLRYIPLEFRQFIYRNISSMYSRLFGGTYIIRDYGKKPILIVSDKEKYMSDHEVSYDMHGIDDNLFDYLFENDYLSIELSWYYLNPEVVDRFQDWYFFTALGKLEPDLDYKDVINSKAKRNKWIEKLDKKNLLPSIYYEFDDLKLSLSAGTYDSFSMSNEMKIALMHPASIASTDLRNVLWHLLMQVKDNDPFSQYAYDKNQFVKMYEAWSNVQKTWIVSILESDYKPVMYQ